MIQAESFKIPYLMNLNIKCKTIKLLEDNTGRNLEGQDLIMNFQKGQPRPWTIKDISHILCELKFWLYKRIKMKAQTENIFAKENTADILVLSKIYKVIKTHW